MTIRIVRFGSSRKPDEGLRIGTVRLALQAETARQWQGFTKRCRAEMAAPDHSRSLDMLAALAHHANFSVGCYCEDESRCHRSVLRALLIERGAKVE